MSEGAEPPPKPKQKRRDDFDLGEVLGQGAFGEVRVVTDKENGRKFAMKVLSKQHIVKEKKMDYVKVERDVMTKLNHPNIVRLLLTFQEPTHLYYVIELAANGDLQHVLAQYVALDPSIVRVLMGQTILGLAHMHSNRIIHRDLKPENMLLDDQNRVKITDFGTAKIFAPDQPFELERGSFVGSADYVCPETLLETPVGPSSDLWSYGCILYAFLVGSAPFRAESDYATFQRIQNCEYEIPEWVPEDARDLIAKLLVINPAERLGSGEFEDNYASIRNHAFFSSIEDWEALPLLAPPAWASFAPAVEHKAARMAAEPAAERGGEASGPCKYPFFLLNSEACLAEGLIVKKRFMSVKKRWLILTSTPRLFYVNEETKMIMGEIPLGKDTKVVLQGGDKWQVEVGARNWPLQQVDGPAPSEWKELIEKLIAEK
jgi:3-phosphoinositide dependent protein kinase-1